jgi:hypothetical protein
MRAQWLRLVRIQRRRRRVAAMMRRVVTWAPVVGTVAASAMLIGAERVATKAFPPLPVPPVERQAMPPFFARITISGDAKMTGVFETCTDPAAALTPRRP